jgi:hypothetical protein
VKTKIFVLITFLLFAGCVKAPPMQVNLGANNVLVAKSDPGDNYEIIGPVSGFDGKGCGGFGYKGSYERAMTSLRNSTHAMGGDYAQIISLTEPHLQGDCFDNEYVIRATAYKKVRNQPSPTPIIDSSEEKMTKKLRELNKLYNDGILTKEEYEQQKSKLLENGF